MTSTGFELTKRVDMIGQSASQQQQQQKLYSGRSYEPRTFSYFCGMEFGKAIKKFIKRVWDQQRHGLLSYVLLESV